MSVLQQLALRDGWIPSTGENSSKPELSPEERTHRNCQAVDKISFYGIAVISPMRKEILLFLVHPV